MSDTEEIAKSVHAALEHDPTIDLHRYPIHIRLEDGALVLEGEVGSIAAKRLASHLARAVQGVQAVQDRLRVSPSERRGDGAVLDSVYQELRQESAFNSYAIVTGDEQPAPEDTRGVIRVLVVEGVVRLEGNVPSLTHKRLAEVLAWWAPGSVDVDNRLHVVPPEQDNDDEISDALRIVLEKDPWLDASQISVHVRNKVVDLEGLLHTQEQKNMAEYNAWYIPGVHEVINRIEVRP